MGFLLSRPALVGILYGLSNVGADGGFCRTRCLAPVLVGVALLAAFVLMPRASGHRTRRRAAAPAPSVASSVGLLFLSGAALYGAMLLLPLVLPGRSRADALAAGLVLVPQGIGALLSRSLAGRLTDSIGAQMGRAWRVIVIGRGHRPVRPGRPRHQWWV